MDFQSSQSVALSDHADFYVPSLPNAWSNPYGARRRALPEGKESKSENPRFKGFDGEFTFALHETSRG